MYERGMRANENVGISGGILNLLGFDRTSAAVLVIMERSRSNVGGSCTKDAWHGYP
jgi:hypothetical protein